MIFHRARYPNHLLHSRILTGQPGSVCPPPEHKRFDGAEVGDRPKATDWHRPQVAASGARAWP